MEKFSLLPLAKRLSDGLTADDEYNRKNFGISVPLWAELLFFLAMIASFFYNPMLGVFLFGTAFFMAGFTNNGSVKSNGRLVENTMWNRLPFTIIGLTIMVFSICIYFNWQEKTDTDSTYHFSSASKLVIKLYIAFLIALIIGRLVFIIASLISVSNRRKSCTYSVDAVYSAPSSPNPRQIYVYEFEGESFAFIYKFDEFFDSRYPTNFPDHVQDSVQLFIDPNAPEKYYLYNMTKDISKKLKKYFAGILILAFMIGVIFVPMWRSDMLDSFLNSL